MLIQVDDIVINTDQIKYMKINDQANYVMIFFSNDLSRKVAFPNYEDLNRFLKTLGLERKFA